MNLYAAQSVRAIPILDYLKDQGMEVEGNRCAAVWRNGDNPTSIAIDPAQNVWYDHVKKVGGSVIDLYIAIEGGTELEAIRTLGDRYHVAPMKEITKRRSTPHAKRLLADGFALVKTYTYTDEAGTPRYYVDRYEKTGADGKRIKEFDQRTDRADNIKGEPRRLYNLPAVINAEEVYLVEGEKDADTLNALGFVATTNNGGCGFWTDELAATLKGKRVVILADNDESGRECATRRASTLVNVATSTKVITISALPKGDITDWMEREGGTADKLRETVANADEWRDTQTSDEPRQPTPADAKTALAKKGIVFTDAAEFVRVELPPPVWIVQDFIAVGMKGDLCGGAKGCKTYYALQLANCIATGRPFLDTYAITEPHKVAYLDLELFPWNSQERMRAQAKGLDIDWERYRGNLLVSHLRGCADKVRDAAPELAAYLKECGVEFTVIDPRYKLLKGGEDENTGEGLRGILQFRDELAAHFAAMFVAHDPKGDNSQKKITDRSAGSYTAGADFDFRWVIDNAEGWKDDNRVHVVEAECRARRPPPPIGVRFCEGVQTFFRDEAVRPVKQDNRVATKRTTEQRAVQEATMQRAYHDAAIAVVVSADECLLSLAQFDAEVAKKPNASLAVNLRGKARNVLVKEGTLATCDEIERKADGTVGKKRHGYTFISTPDRIAAYRRRFGL